MKMKQFLIACGIASLLSLSATAIFASAPSNMIIQNNTNSAGNAKINDKYWSPSPIPANSSGYVPWSVVGLLCGQSNTACELDVYGRINTALPVKAAVINLDVTTGQITVKQTFHHYRVTVIGPGNVALSGFWKSPFTGSAK